MPGHWPNVTCVSGLFFLSLCTPNEGKGLAYLSNNVSKLFFHFLLSTQESLPKIIAYASPLQKRATRLFGGLDVDQALDILNCASEKGCSQDTVWDLRGLFGTLFGIKMQEGKIDISLEVRAEPGCEVCAFIWW